MTSNPQESLLRKPSGLRAPSSVVLGNNNTITNAPSTSVVAPFATPRTTGLFAHKLPRQPTAIAAPTNQLTKSSSLTKPTSLDTIVPTPTAVSRIASVASAPSTTTTATISRLPSLQRIPSHPTIPSAIPSAIPSFQQPLSVASAIPTLKTAIPSIARASSSSSSLIQPSAIPSSSTISSTIIASDDLAAILAAEEQSIAEFERTNLNLLPACFTKEIDVESTPIETPIAASIENDSNTAVSTEVDALNESIDNFLIQNGMQPAHSTTVATAASSFSAALSSTDDIKQNDEEEDDENADAGFGEFTIPDQPSDDFAPIASSSTAIESQLYDDSDLDYQLPPAAPYTEASFPYTLDTSSDFVHQHRLFQLTTAEQRHLELQHEITRAMEKLMKLQELVQEEKKKRNRAAVFVERVERMIGVVEGGEEY